MADMYVVIVPVVGDDAATVMLETYPDAAAVYVPDDYVEADTAVVLVEVLMDAIAGGNDGE